MTDAAHPSDRELSGDQRGRLQAAQRQLAQAVAAYDQLLGSPRQTGQAAPVHDAGEMRVAQERVEAAEDRLWQLREELLGWVRPSWAPSAALVSDWFSEEDAVYDDLPETTS